MKKLVHIILCTWLFVFSVALLAWTGPASAAPPTAAGLTTQDEALSICKNWVTLVLQLKGNWGASKTAEVQTIQEFKRGARTLGYICSVKPQGYIIVSLHRALEPVKAYSDAGNLNPSSDQGMADLLKGNMERTLNTIEQKYGPIASVQSQDLQTMIEMDYRATWESLAMQPSGFQSALASNQIQTNYQGGQVLLTSHWNQNPPYNDQTPYLGCSNSNGRAVVGCVATAGAQIMRYWDWPPSGYYGTAFDWRNMPVTVTTSSPPAQINAVANLSADVGARVGMTYGCGASSAYATNMVQVYVDYGYGHDPGVYFRKDYWVGLAWFQELVSENNLNHPILYNITDHTIVEDGWQWLGSTPQYHMNYGWGSVCNTTNGCDTWYTLDALYYPAGQDLNDEFIVTHIVPAPYLPGNLTGTFPRDSFPYRYATVDTTGDDAIFAVGQHIQFLPNITLKGTSTTGGSIRFYGAPGGNDTILFTRGDETSGIRIQNGALKVSQNGMLVWR